MLLSIVLFFLGKLTSLAQFFRHVLAAIIYFRTKNRKCCDLLFRKSMWCFCNTAEIARPFSIQPNTTFDHNSTLTHGHTTYRPILKGYTKEKGWAGWPDWLGKDKE